MISRTSQQLKRLETRTVPVDEPLLIEVLFVCRVRGDGLAVGRFQVVGIRWPALDS
jgi:hypothetical protein